MKKITFKFSATTFIILSMMASCSEKYTSEVKEGITIVTNEDGATLGYSTESGVAIIAQDRYAFKDLNKNGSLDSYEDWRLPVTERAKDLASKMSLEDIAGLMLYSSHQSIPSGSRGYGSASSDLSDGQKKFLTDDHLRHVLITSVESPAVAAQWNNNAQAFAESLYLGIPVNTSSDPRHGSDSYAEFNAGAGGAISMWPGTLGIAASFDPELMKQFGEIGSVEYRALGITTALSPHGTTLEPF